MKKEKSAFTIREDGELICNVNKYEEIENFIRVLRESFKESYIVYQYGCCYNFYLILKEVFPEAEAYFYDEEKGHIITKIGEKYYDIIGERFKYLNNSFNPILLTDIDHKYFKTNNFKFTLERMTENYKNHTKEMFK